MYFLGHMAWAIVWAVIAWALIPGVKRAGKLVIPAILMLGILPDADLFLESIGVLHRTVTHSFFFWIILFVPVFLIYRLKTIPYFVAVVQHFAFGDLLMGGVMIFWPFNSNYVGLSFGMPSLMDVALETVGLLLSIGLLMYSKDLRWLFSVYKNNIFMLLPLLALLISTLFFASHWSFVKLIEYIASSNLLIVIALVHLILFALLAISTLQGFRGWRQQR